MPSEEKLTIDHINTPKKEGLDLKRLRKIKNLSQSDLAKMMNMRQPTISDVESGKETLVSFFKIIQALKINMELSNFSAEKNQDSRRCCIFSCRLFSTKTGFRMDTKKR